MSKAIFIGAHNDDCEFDAGGMAYFLHKQGWELLFLVPSGLWHKADATAEEIARWEAEEQEAAAILGAKKIVLGDRAGSLYKSGHDSILEIEKVILDFKPDVAFIHWPRDAHQEHRMIAKDSYQALSLACVHKAGVKEIYAFEAGITQSVQYMQPDFSISIDEAMPTLERSLGCFNQPTAHGDGLIAEKKLITSFRGKYYRGSSEYAEAYKIIKFPAGNADFMIKPAVMEQFRWCGDSMKPAYSEYYW
ncbi:MAG: PIG-L family deacetylase [Clostridia bacterium]|nr:PIG-L family deacetylase [Clostridia bacterium]